MFIKQVEINDKWKKLDDLFTNPLKANTLYQLQIVGNTPVYFADDKAYTETDGANGLVGHINTIVNFIKGTNDMYVRVADGCKGYVNVNEVGA